MVPSVCVYIYIYVPGNGLAPAIKDKNGNKTPAPSCRARCGRTFELRTLHAMLVIRAEVTSIGSSESTL